MNLRDDIELTLRAWDRYERSQGTPPIIDFDCHPTKADIKPANSRLEVYRRLADLAQHATGSENALLRDRVDAHLAYLRAQLGERLPLDSYVRVTQGCPAAGWTNEYVTEIGETARRSLLGIGIPWGPQTEDEMHELEGPLDADEAAEAIRDAASLAEADVRKLTGTTATYDLTITTTEVDEYWAYWLDGAGQSVRLRLNKRNARFTQVKARQFALHEVLGHGLQSASLAARCAESDVPWVRVLSVHAPHQVMLEGLAEAMPFFVAPEDEVLCVRAQLDHYLHLVRSELHIGINSGWPIDDLVAHARNRVPFWGDNNIAGFLTDRANNPLLRSYLWAYPAGADWFIALSRADPTVIREVLNAAYRDPLTPGELERLWPAGPPIGGPGSAVRIR